MPTYAAMAVGAGMSREEDSEDAGVASSVLSDGSSMGRGKGRGTPSGSSGRDRASDGVERYEIASATSEPWQSGYSSDGSWWNEDAENWSWQGSRWGDKSSYSNWEWVKPVDPWHDWHRGGGDPWSQGRDAVCHGHDQLESGLGRDAVCQRHDRAASVMGRGGVCHGHDRGSSDVPGLERSGHQVKGVGVAAPADDDMWSPKSLGGGARDVSGDLPSGEVSSAGQRKENLTIGERRGKVSSSYPPIFRAKPGESFKEWKRSVDFWLGGEANQIPPELIGPRLMVQLRDRAGQLVHHLSNADVNRANGMEVIMKVLEKSPIIRQLDRHKVDLHRKKLMQLKRLPSESLESYVTRGSIYRSQLQALDQEMHMGECFYTGHLLDNARLTRKDKVMIKTRAGSDLEEHVTNAMIELAPELEGEPGYPIGSSEPNAAAKQGDEFLVQRGESFRTKPKESYVTEGAEQLGPWEEMSSLGAIEEEAEEEEFPPEMVQAENEAFALQYKARQKIAEVKKLRQYFRRPESAEERKKVLAEKMRTSPCHRCGELGHWSRECPQKAAAVMATQLKSKVEENEWSTLASLCCSKGSAVRASAAYKERLQAFVTSSLWSTLWCQQELHLRMIVDLGCVKSVVGVHWMNELITEWKRLGRWSRVDAEKEVFQFGNGETLVSKYRVQFEARLAGCQVILALSVVPGKCPPLLSRCACSQLGMQIDCGSHSFSSRAMKVKNFGFCRAENGHYLLAVNDFCDKTGIEVPVDFCLPAGCEAHVLNTADTMLKDESSPDNHPAQVCDHGESGRQLSDAGRTGSDGDSYVQALSELGAPDSRLSTDRGDPGRAGNGGGFGGREIPEAGNFSTGDQNFEASITSFEVTEDPRAQDRSREWRQAIARFHRVGSGQPHSRGEIDHPETEGSPGEGNHKEATDQGIDGGLGQLPQSVTPVLGRSGNEHGIRHGITDENLLMEEDALAASCEKGSRSHAACSMEAQPSLAGDASVQGGGVGLRTLWSHEAETQCAGGVGSHVRKEQLKRGATQMLRRGVAEAKASQQLLSQVADLEDRYVVLELFAGSAMLTSVASSKKGWRALDAVDILKGKDLTKKAVQEEIWMVIEKEDPDLVTMSLPCKPWCSWMYLCHDVDKVEQMRTDDMPLWRFARKVWDHQTSRRRLALTENPLASEGLKMSFMEERPQLFRAKVAQCQFGLKDVVSGKPHRKMTAFDVNHQYFARCLEEGAQCQHRPEEHQIIEGQVLWQGRWVNRSMLASRWPRELCLHMVKAAEKTLRKGWQVEYCSLFAEADPECWETAPVSASLVPEENLRLQLATTGNTPDRYGYITFEGIGQQAPRRVRSAVAHLHSTMGHLSNDRLVRMLTLSGAGEQILNVARNLRCQICSMVHPPRDAPQVASRPTNFNERVSGDSFYVWDIKGVKFGVVHFLDGLTDFHIGDATVNPNSVFVSELLRNQWYGVFGPPDALLTDAGTEFAGMLETVNEIFGVMHEVVPEGAKWRLGHAERHGAILKVMIMKMVKSHTLNGIDEVRMAVTAACAAKNRLLNHGGVSPMQAVTGKNLMIPTSLMDQIASGRMKFLWPIRNCLVKIVFEEQSESDKPVLKPFCGWMQVKP